MDDEARHAACMQCRQRIGHLVRCLIFRVVAYLCLEQVSEDVKRVRLHRFGTHEVDEQPRDVQAAGIEVQVEMNSVVTFDPVGDGAGSACSPPRRFPPSRRGK